MVSQTLAQALEAGGCPRVSSVAGALKGRSQADRKNPIDTKPDPTVRDLHGHHRCARRAVCPVLFGVCPRVVFRVMCGRATRG